MLKLALTNILEQVSYLEISTTAYKTIYGCFSQLVSLVLSQIQ